MQFPNLVPTKISSFDTPDYQVVSRQWESGDSKFKRTQYVGTRFQILLEYRMISDTELDQLINIWETSEGCNAFALPQNFFNSYPEVLIDKITSLQGTIKWIIDKEPDVTPKILCGNLGNPQVRWNRYDVDIILRSQIS